MPRHCIIEFNNPVTGQRHPSLLGYLLNQQGVDVETVSEFLEQAYADISPLTKSWGSNNFNSDFVEPRLSDLISLFNQPKVNKSSTQIKPGVEELFLQSPELASIGTSQQYSAYLDTIFPNSKVKDIVYHKTSSKEIEGGKFKISRLGGVYFSFFNIPSGGLLKGVFQKIINENTVLAVVNVKNPFIVNRKNAKEVIKKTGLTTQDVTKLRKSFDLSNNDAVLGFPNETKDTGQLDNFPNISFNENERKDIIELAVFEPEQIHILGNKQDIEGFKRFVRSQETKSSDSISVVPGVLEEINQIQEFYDSKNLSLNTDLNILEANELIKDAQDFGISLELEITNPEDKPSDRIYRIYPVSNSNSNNETVKNFVYQQLNDYYTQVGMPNALGEVSNYVDVLNPTLVGTLKNILSDPTTTQFEKDILNTMLTVLKQFPEIQINFSKDLLSSEYNPENVVPARYEAKTNTITFFVGPLSDMNATQFRHIFMHELTHALFFSTLKNPQTSAEKTFASEIKRIYDYYKAKFPNAAFVGQFYGLQNEQEFLAEFFSNPEFRDILEQEAPVVHGSIFQSVLNFFKKLFSNFLSTKGRTDAAYLNNLSAEFFRNVLNNGVNTTQVYVSEDAFNYESRNNVYNDFLKSFPGKNSIDRFYGALESLLNNPSLNWQSIYKHAKATGIQLNRLMKSDEALENLEVSDVIKTDIKTSFKAVMTHLAETHQFLRNLKNSLTELEKDKSLPEDVLFRRAYHAKNIGEQYKEYIETFKSLMDNPSSSSPMGKFIFNIDAVASELVDGFDSIAAPAIASKFAEYYWPQTEALRKEAEELIADLTEKLNVAERAGNVKKVKVLKDKIELEKTNLKRMATKENLERAFKGILVDGDQENTLGSRIGAFMESAALSGNLVTGSLAGVVDDLHSIANAEAVSLERTMKSLADRLQNHLKAQGKTAFTSLNFADVFGKYVKKVTVIEIKRVNGVLEKVERETFVFQTQMDEVGYLNRYNELKYEMLKLENKPNKTDADMAELERRIDELAQFEEDNLESLYTDEYHRIQNILSEPARKARQEIIDKMRQIQINATQGDQTDEDLDVLEDLKRQLDELENPFGKTPEQQEIAYNIQEWKRERQNANLFIYKLTEENRSIFNDFFNSKKNKVREAQINLANLLGIEDPENNPDLVAELSQASQTVGSDRVELAKEELRLAQLDLDKFKRNNVVRKVLPEFYELRSAILEGIEAIQAKYTTDTGQKDAITELYKELFVLLKPYKNRDGEYEGSKINPESVDYVTEDGELVQLNTTSRVKEIEDRIATLREEMQDSTRISKEDRENLAALFSQLDAMQVRELTQDYKNTVKIEQAKARAAVIAKLGDKVDEMSVAKLNREIIKTYRASDWYKQNHRDFKADGSGTPLFQWRITLPNDPNLISEEEPSFRWYTIEVNDAVDVNGNPLYINKDVRNFKYSKRVPLKRTSQYVNSDYGKMDAVERDIIGSVVDIMNEVQGGLPVKLQLGTELPAYMKDGLEGLSGKVGNLKDQITGVAKNLWDKVSGKEQEELTDKVTFLDKLSGRKSELNKYSDRIHLRYVTPIEADRMSINFFESVTQYGADAIRFKHLYKNMAYILGTRDLVNKNLGGTTTASVVNNIIERKLNGKSKVSLTGNPILNAIGYISDKAIVGLTAKVSLSVNLPSAIKNFTAGSYNIYTQAGRFGLDRKEIAIGKAKAATHLRDFYRASVEDGIETPYLQKMRYFNVMPENRLSESGKKIYRTSLDKTANYNPLKMYAFTRQALEFEMRVGVAEALSKQHMIELQNGTFISIFDAYESVGGILVPRADIKDLASFPAQENHFKGRLNLINSLIHGAYGAMDKPEYQRYAIGRFIMMMRNWFGYQYLSRFASRRMSIRAGMEFEGMYRTLWNVIGYKGTYWKLMSYAATQDLLSNKEKDNLRAALFDSLGISVVMGLSYLISQAVYADDDEDVDNPMAYLALYNLLYLEDELNSLHPVFGPAAIAYSRIENKVSGDDFSTYYYKKYFTEPLNTLKTIGMSMYDYSPMGDANMFDEYVPRSRNGKVMNPNRYKPDPFLQGMPDVVARTLKLFALDKSVNYVIGNQEYMYRKYDYLNPKYFTESYNKELREAKRGQRSNKLEIKAIKEELKLIEDPDTKQMLYEKIDELETNIARDKEEQDILEAEYMEYSNITRK